MGDCLPNLFAQTIEVRPDGSQAYVLEVNKSEYRTFRIRTLYEGIGDQLADGETPAHAAFTATIAVPLAASAAQPATVTALPVVHAMSSVATPRVPVGIAHAHRPMRHVPGLRTTARHLALRAKVARDLWHEGFADEQPHAPIA